MEFFQWLLTLLCIVYCVTNHGSEASFTQHRNPCAQHTVESKLRSVADHFQSDSLFFPPEYREIYCKTYSSSNSLRPRLGTCAGGLYHCATEYKTMEVLQIPNKKQVSLSDLDVRKIKIAVACSCLT